MAEAALPQLNLADWPLTVHGAMADQPLALQPLPTHAPQSLAALADWSRQLMQHPELRQHPDIATFAHWCRPSQMQRWALAYANGPRRVGRGLALHIAPANVPVNFAYSLAFGVLAGCVNIVRVPDAFPDHLRIMGGAWDAVLAQPEHVRLAAMNRLVSYPRDAAVTERLSALCQARVLWGGNATIAQFRAMPTRARCVDVAFADRYSLCALRAEAVLALDEAGLDRLVQGFYNDTYLMQQNACSSPHLVLWVGAESACRLAQDRFWPRLATQVQQRYGLAPIQAVDKYALLCRQAPRVPEGSTCVRHGNEVYRVALPHLPADVSTLRGQHGLFFEHVLPSLSPADSGWAAVVDDTYQTLCVHGWEPQAVVDELVACGLGGIDRVVPVGQALNMGTVWDGCDVVATLSRMVATQ